MTRFSPADAAGLAVDWDNEIHEGLLATVRVRANQTADGEVLVTFMPWDEDGNALAGEAEMFVGTFRRAEEPTP